MVDVDHVSVTYSSDTPALRDVSLRIDDGEFAFVVGENGAGKSTLIKLLIREVTADEGTEHKPSIHVNGYDLMTLKQKDVPLLRRTIGFVFQDFKLINSMNVFDNVAFVLRSIDAPAKYIRKRVPQVIGLMGLGSKINQYPNELSGGEQQRVAIARALVNNPQLIIADEPTGNLDPRAKIETMKLLKEINDKGTTVMIVTHEHDLVKRFGGRLINIKEGRIAFDGMI
ncbi:MAG: ATP-binding cassette domain-containing protein [Oribacterium sp.]|nr:ATP-binding cassette domain-containing protein [Oribacterium sp.]MBQ5330725.1 ATP-binding cassette domain-containing protein [Oscillospiraceae bacterium]